MKEFTPLEVAIKFGELQPFVSELSKDEMFAKIVETFGLNLSIPEESEALLIVWNTLLDEHHKQIAHEDEKRIIRGQIDVLKAQLEALEIKGV